MLFLVAAAKTRFVGIVLGERFTAVGSFTDWCMVEGNFKEFKRERFNVPADNCFSLTRFWFATTLNYRYSGCVHCDINDMVNCCGNTGRYTTEHN